MVSNKGLGKMDAVFEARPEDETEPRVKSEFILAVERRARLRAGRQQHDAHVRARFEVLAAIELEKIKQAPRRPSPQSLPPAMMIMDTKWVPDPMMTDAEYFEQRRTRSGPRVGKVSAEINMVELIGGLARVKDRSEVQEAAAARFRLVHERAQLGGARAIDYTAVRVDTSGGGDAVEFGEQARHDYADAVRYLGMIRSSLVERVVVYDMSLRDIAGQGGRSKAKAKKGLQDALDDLAVHFRLAPKPRT